MFDSDPLPLPRPESAAPAAERQPVDVAALCERVRETAKTVGGLAREARVPAGFSVPAESDPDHHLWKNGAVWWIAFTAHAGVVQERVRFSLGTRDLALARLRRDAALRLFAEARGLGISLRFSPRRRRHSRPPLRGNPGPSRGESGSSRHGGSPLRG